MNKNQDFKKGDKLFYHEADYPPRKATVIRAGRNKVIGRWYDIELDDEREFIAPFRISEGNTPGLFNALEPR